MDLAYKLADALREIQIVAVDADLRATTHRTALETISRRAREALAAHAASLAAPPAQGEWQPIETAPRDSSAVLVAFRNAFGEWRVREAWWRMPFEGAPAEQCWWCYDNTGTLLDASVHGLGASHWTPKPPPPRAAPQPAPAPVQAEIAIGETIVVADLAERLAIKGADVVRALFKMGVMVTINQSIDHDTAVLVAEELGHKISRSPQPPAPGEAEGHIDVLEILLGEYIRAPNISAALRAAIAALAQPMAQQNEDLNSIAERWLVATARKAGMAGVTPEQENLMRVGFVAALAQQRIPESVRAVLAELERATRKFPTWPTDPLRAVAAVGEEAGELTKAVLQAVYEPHKSTPEDVATEAIQTAAMALRFIDSLPLYVYAHSAQHSQEARGNGE